MAMHLSTRRWQDQLIVLLGLWLVVSPWALAYLPDSPLAVNAYVAGAIIAILAVFDLYKTYLWAVVLNLLVGLWVAISPWALNMTEQAAMVRNNLIVGLAVMVLALWELRSDPDLHRQWAGGETP
jgi:hypothetical protein